MNGMAVIPLLCPEGGAIAAGMHMPANHEEKVGIVFERVESILIKPAIIDIKYVMLDDNTPAGRVGLQQTIRPIHLAGPGVIFQVDQDEIQS
jgi:hypothetical protein